MSDNPIWAIGRRGFLALGPAAAVCSAFASSAATAATRSFGLFSPGEADPDRRSLSIGYWVGSDAIADLTAHRHNDQEGLPLSGRSFELHPAESLAAGDPRFLYEDAQIGFHGMFATESGTAPAALSIDARFPAYHDAPHHAWRYHQVDLASANTRFTAPVSAGAGLTLDFSIGTDSPSTKTLHFVAGASAGQPKLRRGLYLIAWRDAAAAPLPSWRHYEILAERSDAQAERPSVTSRLAMRRDGSARRDFSYVLISVDYVHSEALAFEDV